jgi:glutamate-1-semialdehyde 2,1-aminomutase
MQAVFSELAQPGFYECLNETSERLTYGLETILSTAGVPATVQAVGSMFQVFFTPTPVTNYREAVSLSRPEQFDLFFQIMRERGVYLHPVQCGGCPFVSGAHTERDIDETLDRIEAAMPAFKAALREADLLSLV